MPLYRIYIDESGDHTYKNVKDLSRRYLGITGVVIRKDYYDAEVQPALEEIKRRHFTYDVDDPPILVRSQIIKKKSHFGVLREEERNAKWERDILAFFDALRAQLFTVVIDKHTYQARYPVNTLDPYHYSLSVLLNRIRGYLNTLGSGATADIMPESRGGPEDALLQTAYTELRTSGSLYGTEPEYQKIFAGEKLLFKKKEHNVAGLQIADLVAADQKAEVLRKHKRPVTSGVGQFGKQLNAILKKKVNQYGHYLLK